MRARVLTVVSAACWGAVILMQSNVRSNADAPQNARVPGSGAWGWAARKAARWRGAVAAAEPELWARGAANPFTIAPP